MFDPEGFWKRCQLLRVKRRSSFFALSVVCLNGFRKNEQLRRSCWMTLGCAALTTNIETWHPIYVSGAASICNSNSGLSCRSSSLGSFQWFCFGSADWYPVMMPTNLKIRCPQVREQLQISLPRLSSKPTIHSENLGNPSICLQHDHLLLDGVLMEGCTAYNKT
jgi:hypothetical protein